MLGFFFSRSAEALSRQNGEGRQKQSVNTQVHTFHTPLQHKHTHSTCSHRRPLTNRYMKFCADNHVLKFAIFSVIVKAFGADKGAVFLVKLTVLYSRKFAAVELQHYFNFEYICHSLSLSLSLFLNLHLKSLF